MTGRTPDILGDVRLSVSGGEALPHVELSKAGFGKAALGRACLPGTIVVGGGETAYTPVTNADRRRRMRRPAPATSGRRGGRRSNTR